MARRPRRGGDPPPAALWPKGTVDLVTELVGATGPVDRPFPWASVTKPVTALAVLVAVEEGTLALDAPAGPPGLHRPPPPGPRLGARARSPVRRWRPRGPAASTPTPATWRWPTSSPNGRACRSPSTWPRVSSIRSAWTAPSSRAPAGAAAAGLAGPLADLVALGRRVGGAHAGERRDPWRDAAPSSSRAGRGAARVRAVRSLRLGPGRRGPGAQAAPLDGHVQLARHLRTLRSDRARSCGWTRSPACVRRPGRPPVRAWASGPGRPWPMRSWPMAAVPAAATAPPTPRPPTRGPPMPRLGFAA